MIYPIQLILLSAYLVTINAAPVTHDERQSPVESDGLSTEAVLTLIGVCVAVFGIVLTLVLKWDSLERICIRCCHLRARTQRIVPDSGIALARRPGRFLVSPHTIGNPSEDEIAEPRRVRIYPTEQQRMLLRTRTM